MRKQLGELLSRLRIGWGTPFNGSLEYNLKGFRPLPLVRLPKDVDYEYEVGIPWYLKNIHGTKILDMGFSDHYKFTEVLSKLGLEVYGVDITEKDVKGIVPIYCLAWELPLWLKDFDTIIANSFLEHMGLKCYGQPEFPGATQATMEAFKRVLKPSGRLLIQVPYGKEPTLVKAGGEDFYRVFTSKSLYPLLEGFEIEEKLYLARASPGWIEVSESVAETAQQGGGFPSCLLFMKLRKP